MTIAQTCDVAIIGAGPAGSVAAAILAAKGYDVVVLERQQFPRFSIGESLLPQCMDVLDEAGMVDAVTDARFQIKNGATFDRGGARAIFDFSDKFSPGWSTTYEVQRDRFDKLLADQAAEMGVAIHYCCEITEFDLASGEPVLSYREADGNSGELSAKFCLDASGFGQTLANLLGMVRPTDWPSRESVFTHVVDHIDPETFDRDKILITVHPERHDIWYWLIPFTGGISSLGVVGAEGALRNPGEDDEAVLWRFVSETGLLASLLTKAEAHRPCNGIAAYASNVEKLHGEKFALLGNAGGFLDPVFSSGVTIALRSASLAADCLDRQFRGRSVDWESEFGQPLARGVDTFRQFGAAWYDGRLQDIIFTERQSDRVRHMICSILAGYAWDENNPYVAQTERRLTALAEICKIQ